MTSQADRLRERKRAALLLALMLLGGCSSLTDLGRLQPAVVSDDIHAWVGQEAAARAGAPISLNHLTDEERKLRNLAFPLIEPPYDRQRWDAILYEYGEKKEFQQELWVVDPTAYYQYLMAAGFRSTAGRYNKLIDDIRDDIVRIGPFFDTAHRVIDLDLRREAGMNYLHDIGPPARANAQARVGENNLTIAWVQTSLAHRCAGYRYALDHLAVGEPDGLAAQADMVLSQLKQQVAANQLVPSSPFVAAAAPVIVRK